MWALSLDRASSATDQMQEVLKRLLLLLFGFFMSFVDNKLWQDYWKEERKCILLSVGQGGEACEN